MKKEHSKECLKAPVNKKKNNKNKTFRKELGKK